MKLLIKGTALLLCLIASVCSCQNEAPVSENLKTINKSQAEILQLISELDTVSNMNVDAGIVLADSLEVICNRQQFGFGLAKAYLFKSGLYGRSGNMKKSFDYLTKAYKLADSLKIDTLSCDVHNTFAIYYDVNHKPDKAIQEIRRSMEYIQPTMYKRLSRAYCNLGYEYEHKDQLETAFNNLLKGLEYAKLAESPDDIGNCYLGLGVVKALQGEFKESIRYSKEAGRLFRSTNNLYYLKEVQINLGSAYIQIPEIDSALFYYMNSLSLYKSVNDSIRLPMIYEAVSLAYRDKGDYKQAYLYLDSSLYAERDATKIKQTKAMAEAEAKFSVDLKNKNIQLLSRGKELQQNRIQHQRQWILILSLLAVLLMVITLFFIRNNTLKKRKNELLELKNIHQQALQKQLQLDNLLLQQENLQSRYNSLKDQISPHFLFNSLNSLNGLIPKDSEKAVKFVEELATVYRYLLKNNELSLVEISEELKFVDSYSHLLKTRFGSSFRLIVNIPESVTHKFIAPLTLQLLIENAAKHNVISKEKPLEITMEFEDEFLIVRNNYQPKLKKLFSTKVGLSNIRKRYELLGRNDFHFELTHKEFVVWVPVLEEMLNK